MFHQKMGIIKDRSGRHLVEAEETKKRWREYVEKLHKKDLNEPDNHKSVVSHPEPDTLECKVTRALGSTAVNKASGCNGILVEIFKTLKEDAVKVLHSICQQIWKNQQWPQGWKISIPIQIPKRDSIKDCSNHGTIAFNSRANKVMLKISRARLQHHVNQELPDVQAGFRKGRGTRSNCQHSLDHRESKGIPEKHLPLFH